MKIKTRMIAVILSVISIVGVCCMFSGCQTEAERAEANSFTDGYFKYYYIKQTDSYAIVGDGDVPYPETLAIPAYYNGKEVTDIYYPVNSGIYFNKVMGPSLKNVEIVYYPFLYEDDYEMTCFYDGLSAGRFYPSVVFCVNNKNYMSAFRFGGIKLYYTKNAFDAIEYTGGAWLKETFSDYKIVIYYNSTKKKHCEFQIANTSYMFNYEGAPNDGYFFINDFERGGLIEDTPYEPQREGYTFGGWYKEPECINKWDFAQDKLPEATCDEAGYVTDFVETKLYAAWIQN